MFASLQDPPQAHRDSLQERDLRARFAKAKVVANDEQVLLDKLGKTRGFVEFMMKAGGAAAEVRKILFPLSVPG